MERILQQPFAKEAEGYVVKFRRDLVAVLSREVIEPVSLHSTRNAIIKNCNEHKSTLLGVNGAVKPKTNERQKDSNKLVLRNL